MKFEIVQPVEEKKEEDVCKLRLSMEPGAPALQEWTVEGWVTLVHVESAAAGPYLDIGYHKTHSKFQGDGDFFWANR